MVSKLASILSAANVKTIILSAKAAKLLVVLILNSTSLMGTVFFLIASLQAMEQIFPPKRWSHAATRTAMTAEQTKTSATYAKEHHLWLLNTTLTKEDATCLVVFPMDTALTQ